MPMRRRSTPWKSALHQSELLPELRRRYAELAAKSTDRAPWYELARKAQLNAGTVQRLLACTKVKAANTGRHLAGIEALARAMNLRIELVPIVKPKP